MKVQGRYRVVTHDRLGYWQERAEKPSIPTLNHVIASVNIRLPGCIVLRSQLGQGPHPSPIQGRGSRHFRISEAVHCARPSRCSPSPFLPTPLSLSLSHFSVVTVPSLSFPLALVSSSISLASLYTLRSVSSRSSSLFVLRVLSSRGNTVPRGAPKGWIRGRGRGVALSRWGF